MRCKSPFLLLVIILTTFSAWYLPENAQPHSCTIFTAVQGETVLFGDNFDYHKGDLIIGFFPPSAAGYGSVHFGYREGEGQFYQRAANDQGLTWAVNSVPKSKLTPQPEKRYSHAEDNYLSTITKRASTVEDVIRIAQNFDFGDSLEIQIHIADASGDAVVIGPGLDGEIAFTRKATGEGYLLSTNFNLATQEGPVDFRWDTGSSMLAMLNNGRKLTPEFAGEVLEAVHLKTLTTHTLFSNVIDLKTGEIYIYYMAQYDEAVKLNIAEELAKGQRILDARDLFSEDTAQAGDVSYQKFETRFFAAIGIVITSILGLVLAGIAFVANKFKRRNR